MPATRTRKRRRRWIILWIALVLLGGITINLFLALRPAALEARLRAALSDILECSFELDSFHVGLARGLEIRGLRLVEAGGGRDPIVSAGRIHIVPRLRSLLSGSLRATRVEIHDLDLEISRADDGSWNLERVLKPRAGPPAEGAGPIGAEAGPVELPRLVIDGCRIRYRDRRTFARPVEQIIENLFLSVRAEDEAGMYAFEGDVRQEFARRLSVAGRFSLRPEDRIALDARVHLFKLDLQAPLEKYLDAELAERLRALDLRGFLDAEAALRFDAQEGFRVQDVRARLVQAEAAPPQLPFAIRGLSGDLRFESGAPAAAVLSVAGEMGGGLLVARADARLDPATLRLVDWSAHVEIDSLRLDPRQIGSWDPALRDVLASLQPRGPLRVALSVPAARSWAVDPRDLEIEVVAGGMDFAYSAFPYPLTDARFTARVRGGELSVDRGASVRCGEGTIALAEGHRFLVELRRGGKVEIDLEASDLALDDRLRGALPLLGRSIWDDLQPGGRASAAITVRREGVEAAGAGALEAGVAPLAVRVDARVADARIQYRLFPYEVSAITGGVVYSSLEGKVRMQNLEGSHGEHRIRGEGEIDLRTEPRVRLDLASDDLAIDEDMLAALPDVARRLLLDFRFEGRVKLERVGIDTADLETPVQVLLADVQGSVNHHGFPYPLRIGGGRFEYRGLKEIRLRDWRTPEESRPGIAFGVDVNAARQPCNIVYRARIAALDVDDRFRDALPIPLRELVSDLGLRGEYSGDLEVEHSLFESDLASSRIIYRAKNVESENAAVSFGIDVAEIRCSGNFEGSCGSGVAAIHSGDILVKSGRFNRLRLKDGRINFVFGEPHPLLGGERRGKYLPPVTFRLPAEYGAILDDKSARSAFQMAVTTDDFYGGQTSGFLFVKAGEGAEFGGHFISRDIDVQQASRDVFAVESENISGRASGQVSFRGPRGDSRGIRGDGEGKIVDGRLAELPIFFNILRLVNLNFDTASATRFNEIALPFRIEAGEFHSSAIEIKSSVMTLSGKGTMDFDGRLDLVLQPSFFPVEIPGLDEILGILKRVLSEIRVTGDLGDPKVDFKTAGGLLPILLSSPRERETAPQEKR